MAMLEVNHLSIQFGGMPLSRAKATSQFTKLHLQNTNIPYMYLQLIIKELQDIYFCQQEVRSLSTRS